MSIEKAFGQVIKDLRRKRGLTWLDLSALCGISRVGIWEIEKGRASPKLVNIYKLADALQVGADELMRRTSIAYRDQVR